MISISTREELKSHAEEWGWCLLSEGDGAIAFLLRTGQTLTAGYDPDTDKLIKLTDTSNAVVQIPFIYNAKEDLDE